MTKQHIDPTDLPKVSSKGSKRAAQAALNDLGWTLQKLVHQQSLLVRAQKLKPLDISLVSHRLQIFEASMTDIVEAYERIDDLMFIKQAGGKPANKNVSTAYEMVKAHYASHKKIIQAKALVKALNLKIFGTATPYDKNGNGDAISERQAGDCIRMFKISLPYEIFDDM